MILCTILFAFSRLILLNAEIESERCHHHGYNFSYAVGMRGPYNWPVIYSSCAGTKQSPINIDTYNMENLKVRPLEWNFGYFSTPKYMTLMNNGHELVLQAHFDTDCRPTLNGGPLHKAYKFHSITFHWGDDETEGSEHTIDELAYPMEMQVIHTCSSNTDQSRNLVIVAYLFQVTNEENKPMNKILQVFIQALKHPYQPIKLKRPFTIASLATPFSYSYVTYYGSITIPPCTEGVRWIVYPYPLDISKPQMEIFRKVGRYAPDLRKNFRPLQPINNRKIYFVT
ncbi:hypothetical protein ILUMI_25730 [Ignelater luminosus]|uniref:Alpha-carbonic anhydrase domain-containing protein n=1 Tax=Ignelater luminosus TaxID=2038154 RepID=A0A8K0FXQ6_IGNLU|nr:hypothetical protein ILUMI_25730 [Ignelater luminosus]